MAILETHVLFMATHTPAYFENISITYVCMYICIHKHIQQFLKAANLWMGGG